MSGNNRPGNPGVFSQMTFIDGIDNLQLDIVGFLAVLGEGSVLANAQVSALSRWIFLPRLLPAPQALLRTSRSDRLEGVGGRTVIGATSGNIRKHLNQVAHILHSQRDASGDYLAPNSVKVVQLSDVDKDKQIKARQLSPPTALTLVGCFLAVVLFIYSILQGDGPALLATILLSALSTLTGVGSYWHIKLPVRRTPRVIPPSDIIIYYAQGAFLIIKDCTEDLARKLYFAPEECTYMVNEQTYRVIALIGTVMLMGGVIALANANTYTQLAFAIAYIIINAAYWIAAGLPQHWNWDLSSFHVEPVQVIRSFGPADPVQNDTFTEALWHAIAVTRSSRWMRVGDIAPNTPAWDAWLAQAEARANEGYEQVKSDKGDTITVPQWDPHKVYSGIVADMASKV